MGTNAAAEQDVFTIPDEVWGFQGVYDRLVAELPDPRYPAPGPVVDVKKAAGAMAKVAQAAKKEKQ